MKKHFYKKIIFVTIFSLCLFFIQTSRVSAQPANPGANGTQNPVVQPGANGTIPPKPPVVNQGSTKNEPIKLVINNPLGVTSIEQMIQKIMSMIVKLAVPVIICFFLYSGFMFITAQGDKTKLATAKRMFFQVVIGSVIILGAWTIAAAIVSTVNLITG